MLLIQHASVFYQVVAEFEEQWENGEVEGWKNEGRENGHVSQDNIIDLDYYSTVEELMEVGPEKLKEVSHFFKPCILFRNFCLLAYYNLLIIQ